MTPNAKKVGHPEPPPGPLPERYNYWDACNYRDGWRAGWVQGYLAALNDRSEAPDR